MLAGAIPIYIAVTMAIGVWASRRIKTTEDFTLAGKSLSASLVGVTIFATWFGPEFIMGVPGRFVDQGVQGIITDQFGTLLCLILVGSFYVKRMYALDIVTVSDFFGLRYHKNFEIATGIIQVFTYFFWIAAQFVALAYLFNTALGVSVNMGIVLGALIVVIYTYIGGMWAVSYTDLLQSVLIVLGLSILAINTLQQVGGWEQLWANTPEKLWDFFPEANFYAWTDYLAMWMAFGIGAIPAQEIYQRVFSARNEKTARQGVFLSALLLFTICSIPILIGWGAFQLHPELMANDGGQSIIPAMVAKYTSLPIQILFFGALISAILSTSSGAMLAPATVIGENLIKPLWPHITDKVLLRWTRLSVLVVAVISCLVAFNDANIHKLVVASAVLLLVCLFAPLTFGLFWKKASKAGAWGSIIVGALAWLLAYLMDSAVDATIIGTVSSCLTMVIASYLWPDFENLKGAK
jgi:SSS family transporter